MRGFINKYGLREALQEGGWGGYVWCCCPGAAASDNEQRYGNTSAFASISPPGVVTNIYQGVAIRLMGGRTEQRALINQGEI